jgi:hypothetical protein
VAHLGAGHSAWSAYFVSSYFVLGVLEWLEGVVTATPVLRVGLVLFALMLRGAVHMCLWCALFVALVAARFGLRGWPVDRR